MSARLASAGPADVGRMSAVMDRAFDPRFGEAWTQVQLGGALATVDTWAEQLLDEEGACVGFALVRRTLDEAELLLVAVAPEARRQGLGRRLVEAAARGAQFRGCRMLFLEVRAGNSASFLYTNAGFVEVGRRKDYYLGAGGARFDAITMRRDL